MVFHDIQSWAIIVNYAKIMGFDRLPKITNPVSNVLSDILTNRQKVIKLKVLVNCGTDTKLLGYH